MPLFIEQRAGLVYTIYTSSTDAEARDGPRGREAAPLKEIYKALEDLVWLTQLGLSIMMPPLLCLGGCWWAVARWGWPEWLYIPAVVLGLGSGAQSFAAFSRRMIRRARKGTPGSRTGFNNHQ